MTGTLLLILLLLGSTPSALVGQTDPTHVVAGMVLTPDGGPVDGANVFLAETLEGVLTDAQGRFVIRSRHTGAATLVAQRLGMAFARRPVRVPADAPIVIVLSADVIALEGVTVAAGVYTAGGERGASLTSLEVVTLPGTRADVGRAFQTLPGVQGVDEGSGLFVRGGDAGETRIFLDGAVVAAPHQVEAPTGSVSPTVDPFLLDGIFFSTGGFGARYGNALSAVADLRTLGTPALRRSALQASLASVSGRTSVPLGPGAGIHLTASLSDTRPMFRLNGSTRAYDPAPRGHAVSASLPWRYRPTGELKAFAIRQAGDLGVLVEEPSFAGTYDSRNRSDLAVLSWRELWGRAAPFLSLSYSALERRESLGAFRLRTEQQALRAFGEVSWEWREWLRVRGGGEWERLEGVFDGAFPLSAQDRGAGAPARALASRAEGDRAGAFAEAEWRPRPRLRLTPGLRTDRSTLTGERSFDPRLSLAYAIGAAATLLASGGVYHQVPDPLFFAPGVGVEGLPPMRATQYVLGAQAGAGARTARLELYEKRYAELAQLSSERRVVAGGTGASRGLDLFLRGETPGGVEGRLAYSLLHAERTDPDTRVVARAPFDVTHTLTLLGEREWAGRWRLGGAYRAATGRPTTPVLGADLDARRGLWVPRHGPAMSERLPDFHRLDLSATALHRFSPSMLGVFYLTLTNVLDRENVFAYRYTADYSERIPVRSQSKRTVFFGASVSF
jgi:vitamin B12 transporter